MTKRSSHRPVVGITMGDAAGIGPEIVLKALTDRSLRTAVRCVIIGDALYLREQAESLALDLQFADLDGAAGNTDVIEIVDLKNLPKTFDIGIDAAVTGRASAENIVAAVELCQRRRIDAIATAPISKKAIAMGGYDFPGHTEFLAKLTNTEEFRMSFFAAHLRVVLLSTHLPLIRAIELIRKESLIKLIGFADRELSKLLGREITIAVAGVNPHASEGGMFGSEEADEIIPAVQYCRDVLNINVSGPYSPDTIFVHGYKGNFDCIVALYHDQATIAVKSLSFGSGVNVTLGLPLIRTSVDHGTAYDIAGKGLADPSSMAAAINLAGELASGSLVNTHI